MLDNNAIVEKLTSLKKSVVFSVSRQEVREHSGIAEQRIPDVGSNFLKKDDVGRLGSLEDVIEDEFAAFDGHRVEGIDVSRYVGKKAA